MSKLDEIYRLHRLLDGRRTGISRAALIGEHGFARSTLSRLIADLRNKLGAPLENDLERGGYFYDSADGRHPLPGLWFSADELLALVTLKHLLANLEPGLLDDHLRPLQTRIDQLLASQHLGAGEAAQLIRLPHRIPAQKPAPLPGCRACRPAMPGVPRSCWDEPRVVRVYRFAGVYSPLERGPRSTTQERYSHSIVAGGLPLMS